MSSAAWQLSGAPARRVPAAQAAARVDAPRVVVRRRVRTVPVRILFARWLLLVLTASLVTAAVAGPFGGRPAPLARPRAEPVPAWAHQPALATVVLGPGDTVWDVALAHAPAGTDPGVWVARVLAANRLDPRTIRPGTVLRLPAP